MAGSLAAPTQPEKIIDGVRERLAAHALWQAALFFLPPLLAAYYVIFFLHRFGWLEPDEVMLAGAALLIIASVAAAGRARALAPSRRRVARLLDERAGGADRFVTLATIDPRDFPPGLVARLTAETAAFHSRIEAKRDFPFRLRRAFLDSCIGALAAILIFHLLLELAPLFKSDRAESGDLARLSEQLAGLPGLQQLAENLKRLAAELRDPSLPPAAKRAQIEELRKQVERARAGREQESGKRDELLGEASKQLNGLEEGLGSGPGQGKGAGGNQVEGVAERGAGQGAAGGGQEEKQNGVKTDAPFGAAEKKLQGPLQQDGREEREQAGARAGGEDARRNKDGGAGRGPKENTESKSGSGRPDEKSAEQTPQRFLRPGDTAGAGLKDSRFVIVQLPEDEDQAAAGGGASDRGRKSAAARAPVGNLPLGPADQPNAAPEKQMLPLEYRSMIR